jgi:hypothetical protein
MIGLMATATNAHAATNSPQTSGEKCDGSVCAKVYGTGLKVTQIDTYIVRSKLSHCVEAHYLIVKGTDFDNGTVLRSASSAQVCSGAEIGPGFYKYSYTFKAQVPDKLPYTCPSRSTLGVFWDTVSGDPHFDIYA